MADHYPAQKDYALLIVIILVGAYLRFDGLNLPGLWLDEVSYTSAAQRSILSQIIKSTETLGGYLSVDPTLSAVPFSLALKLGFSNFLARFPATIFGILAIPFFYKLGRTLFGNRAGLVAALLLSLSGFHILYSQEARSYTGLVLFSIVSYLYFYKAITEKNRSNWVVYALATWAGVSTSHLMLFTIASQGLGLISIVFRDLWLSKSDPEAIKAALRVFSTFLLSLLVVGIFRSFWWEDFTQRQCFGCDVGNPSYPLDLINSFSRSLDAFTGSSPIIAAGQITLCLLGL
ncbi:MAG TPA: glycosyltransferase family 39 protein, partial [Anaerolineae bacterium]